MRTATPQTTPLPTSWRQTGAWIKDRCGLLALLLIALALLSTAACVDTGDLGDERTLVIDQVSPSSAHQGESIRLLGAGFGDTRPDQANAWVGGVCTAITGWSDDAVTVVVPSGAGLGDRLVVLTVNGRVTAPAPLRVTGEPLNDDQTYCDESPNSGGR